MFKVEPIDLLAEMVYGQVRKISAGSIIFTRMPIGSGAFNLLMTYDAAKELANEGLAYKNFFNCANVLAILVESRADGMYVDSKEIERATDLYLDARKKCQKLLKYDISVKRERS